MAELYRWSAHEEHRQIAAELQGYDPQALSADQVNEFLARLVEPVRQTENVGVFDALDRVLAQDLVSPFSVPPHDNYAMDGYAFDGSQIEAETPIELDVIGTALAGKAWQGTVGPGQCVKIMTGAIMPQGLTSWCPKSSPAAGEKAFRPAVLQPATTAGSRARTAGGRLALHRGSG
jgi:molybdopterin molybdotransferase